MDMEKVQAVFLASSEEALFILHFCGILNGRINIQERFL